MPLHSAAEDSQPNEQRRIRKGTLNVPTIRVSSHPSAHRPARGGPSGRASRGSATQHHTAEYPYCDSQASTSRLFHAGGSHAGSVPQYSWRDSQIPVTQHTQARHYRPTDTGYMAHHLDAPKRPSDFHDGHQVKRKRISSPLLPSVSYSTPAATPQGASLAASDTPGQSSNKEITMDLPEHCYSGVTGCKLSRRQWRECETRRLEQDGQTEVYHVESMNRHMRFFCRTRSALETCPQSRLNHPNIKATSSAPAPKESTHTNHYSSSIQGRHFRAQHAEITVVESIPSRTAELPVRLSNSIAAPGASIAEPAEHIISTLNSALLRQPSSDSRISTHMAPAHTSGTDWPPYAPHPFQSGSLLIQSDHLAQGEALVEDRPISASPSRTSNNPSKTRTKPSAPLTANSGRTQLDPTDRSAPNSPIIRAMVLPPLETMDIVQIYLPKYDKSRRICRLSSEKALIHLSMHGFIDRVNLSPLRTSHSPVPGLPQRHDQVDDACCLEAFDRKFIIMGHAREDDPISIVDYNAIETRQAPKRPSQPAKKGGVSAVCAMSQPSMFASGGYDHVVHLWTLKNDITTSTAVKLAVKHNSIVQTLLPMRDSSHKLLSGGADSSVHVWDLSSERVVNNFKTSNSVYNAHATSSPYCTLIEVAHRDLQFELRDHRLVPKTPVQRFGYEAEQFHGRYIKGDMRGHYFACGGRDGLVRFWDVRSHNSPSKTVACFLLKKVVQVVFDVSDADLLACSEGGEILRIERP